MSKKKKKRGATLKFTQHDSSCVYFGHEDNASRKNPNFQKVTEHKANNQGGP